MILNSKFVMRDCCDCFKTYSIGTMEYMNRSTNRKMNKDTRERIIATKPNIDIKKFKGYL